MRYHDEEWGVPLFDDVRLFEFLVLESAQAGLSWITILRKREGYRRRYRGFHPRVVASSVSNAQRFLEVQGGFGSFARYLWSFVYASLQAVGVVNDHVVGCFRREEIIRGYDSLAT
jgi:DNA-3-methyladenine glycosylase I